MMYHESDQHKISVERRAMLLARALNYRQVLTTRQTRMRCINCQRKTHQYVHWFGRVVDIKPNLDADGYGFLGVSTQQAIAFCEKCAAKPAERV